MCVCVCVCVHACMCVCILHIIMFQPLLMCTLCVKCLLNSRQHSIHLNEHYVCSVLKFHCYYYRFKILNTHTHAVRTGGEVGGGGVQREDPQIPTKQKHKKHQTRKQRDIDREADRQRWKEKERQADRDRNYNHHNNATRPTNNQETSNKELETERQTEIEKER